MGELNKEIKKEEIKELVLNIILKQDGNVQVSGPLVQKPLCLYMLELAKDVVKLYNPNPPIIQPRSRIRDIFKR